MTDREALVAAVAADPRDDAPRLIFADWLDEHGEPERAAFVRGQCQAARLRPGTDRRLELLRRTDDLLCEHEPAWLGDWSDRLVDWTFERGFLRSVRLTADAFLRHGEALFRAEPVERVELVNEEGGPLGEDAVREVVASPAFGFVQECAVVSSRVGDRIPLETWLRSLAAGHHVTRLRAFGPTGGFNFAYNSLSALEAFCRAPHLHTLTALDLGGCPLGSNPDKDRLVSFIAGATFAPRLRKLVLRQCCLTEQEIYRVAAAAVFRGLRRLDVSCNTESPDAWRALFHSQTLARVSDITITANHLPQYAGSPLAGRARGLTVHGWDDLHRDPGEGREAWAHLIATGRRPRRLDLNCHNPGRETFAQMRRGGWLRRVQTLAVSGDSQYGVYSGRTAGVRLLLGSNALPRVARLRLHEVADRKVLSALASWPGLPRLEELSLTDDYFGRLWPGDFNPGRPLTGLRRLKGLHIETDADIDTFLRSPGLEGLRHLELSFVGVGTDGGTVEQVSHGAAARLLQSPALRRLESLQLGFDDLPDLMDSVLRLFTDPGLMPRLRSLFVWGYAGAPEAVEAIRPRFGLRLRT